MTEKPSVLVFGLGPVGRHIIRLLVEHNVASFIRVVDSTPPQLQHLSPACLHAISQCEFIQANFNHPGTLFIKE